MQERCLFYVAQEYAEGTCGPRNFEDTVEDPKLFVVRFQKQSIEDALKEEKRTNNILHTLRGQDSNLASQLVARYNGSDDIQEVCAFSYFNNLTFFCHANSNQSLSSKFFYFA